MTGGGDVGNDRRVETLILGESLILDETLTLGEALIPAEPLTPAEALTPAPLPEGEGWSFGRGCLVFSLSLWERGG